MTNTTELAGIEYKLVNDKAYKRVNGDWLRCTTVSVDKLKAKLYGTQRYLERVR